MKKRFFEKAINRNVDDMVLELFEFLRNEIRLKKPIS